MNDSAVNYLLVGLLFGTTLLTLGVAIGFWVAKRLLALANTSRSQMDLGGRHDDQSRLMGDGAASPSHEEVRQITDALRDFAHWTTDFTGDFSKYKNTIQSLDQRFAKNESSTTPQEVRAVLDEIISANKELHVRLESAERQLQHQTATIAGFLSEARTDSLTGLANRRAFDQKIEACFLEWVREDKKFCLALVDVDHFKSVNDRFGHPVGDIVLRSVAQHLSTHAKSAVQVARYGGEEFAILLPTQIDRAADTLEQLRKSLQVEPLQADGNMIAVTISIGVSEALTNDRIGTLVRRSDEALYSAKLAGRNLVYLHDGHQSVRFTPETSSPNDVANDSVQPVVTLNAHPNAEVVRDKSDALRNKVRTQIDSVLERR